MGTRSRSVSTCRCCGNRCARNTKSHWAAAPPTHRSKALYKRIHELSALTQTAGGPLTAKPPNQTGWRTLKLRRLDSKWQTPNSSRQQGQTGANPLSKPRPPDSPTNGCNNLGCSRKGPKAATKEHMPQKGNHPLPATCYRSGLVPTDAQQHGHLAKTSVSHQCTAMREHSMDRMACKSHWQTHVRCACVRDGIRHATDECDRNDL